LSKDFTSPTWNDAFQGFLLHLQATRAPKTVKYYQTLLGSLIHWAGSNSVPLEKFGKRQMDSYLVFRSQAGLAQLTLHHDAVCAKAFLRWCQKNDYVKTSLLAGYEVRNAPAPYKYMPTEEDMQKLVAAVRDFWDVEKHPGCRFNAPARRAFNRDRNYAIILLLLDSACRINEVLHLQLEDYKEKERMVTIRESKGREPRSIPVSNDTAEAVKVWLTVRQRAMKDVPKAELLSYDDRLFHDFGRV
jgi:integrase/recombinase XerD